MSVAATEAKIMIRFVAHFAVVFIMKVVLAAYTNLLLGYESMSLFLPKTWMIMMNKPPSFQFYPADFLSSPAVAAMTAEEVGAYILLLSYAWASDDCGLPNDDETLSRLSRLGERWFNGGSTVVRACFTPEGTRLYNKRLLKERKKTLDWIEKSKKGGKISAKLREQKRLSAIKGGSTTVERVVQPKANSSSSPSPSPSIDNKEGESHPLTSLPTLRAFYPEFWNFVTKRHPTTKPPKPNTAEDVKAKTEFARLVTIDGFSEADVVGALQWAFNEPPNNGFSWSTNIQGTLGLRKKKGDASKFQNIYAQWHNKSISQEGIYAGDDPCHLIK